MTNIVYVNGQYLSSTEATVSVFDRGFLFGDAVYEVIPVYEGRTFFLDRHLKRLKSSLAKAKISLADQNWPFIFNQLIEKNGGGDLQLYLQISRGVQEKRKHDINPHLQPTIIAFTLHTPYSSHQIKSQGLKAQIIEDIRWLRCDIKSTSMLANVLMNDEAITSGADTALLTRNGFLIEGSASNVFIVDQEGTIITPPLGNHCLAGVTRELTIELIRDCQLKFKEDMIPTDAALTAREVWITSTTKEIFPIISINHTKINNGKAGQYWQLLDEKFQQLVKTHGRE